MSFIDDHDFSVGRAESPSRRQREDAELLERIEKIRSSHEFAATDGSPRVWLQLRRQGVRCSRKRVERIMRANGLVGAHLRKGWKTGSTRQNPAHTAAPDLVERDFTAAAPNRLWVADLTRLLTGEGVLWLASVRDAFSNRIVGWATAARADTELVLTTLEYRLWSRDVRSGALIHHSDKGCQYTALRFTQRLADAGVAPSTGSVGDSFDNALAENLWSTIKIELLYWPGTTFATRAEADAAIFRYIDGWYNPRRIQAGLGGLSPDEYEEAYNTHPRDQHDAGSIPLTQSEPDNQASDKAGKGHQRELQHDLGQLLHQPTLATDGPHRPGHA
ncbi:IS3 family transposase [Saccharopolyspora elongata]|uniref:IS3 family transposase n=1 Tax=Saccharopolyspora elongata TaxID=2530387 RepID=A0A4R4XP08_9PSEU|nr:IS3 family transposase [Saccharopolyspora elongata]TDD33058.1 IS3 family transposase [Saccharopolyspora elongata]